MKHVSKPFLALCLALCALHGASAAELTYPEVVLDDVKHVVTSPARWEEQEWRTAGWSTLAVVGTALAIDRPLRDEMRRHTR